MNRFPIARQAEQDLQDIWPYLGRQDELLADQKIAQILDRFPLSSQFPDLGRQRDDLPVVHW